MAQLAETDIRRQVAYKCSIADIKSGVFMKRQGWESSFVMTDYGDFSRVNIIAVVISKEDNALTLDDGSASIIARTFNDLEKLSHLNVGDVVLTIARPREFNNQLYLAIEIIRKIDNRRWIAYRRKELSLIKKVRDVSGMKEKQQPAEAVEVESESTMNSKEKIIKVISQLDSGSGASIDDVMQVSRISNAEDIIQDMLLKGEIFEIKAGKLKLM